MFFKRNYIKKKDLNIEINEGFERIRYIIDLYYLPANHLSTKVLELEFKTLKEKALNTLKYYESNN